MDDKGKGHAYFANCFEYMIGRAVTARTILWGSIIGAEVKTGEFLSLFLGIQLAGAKGISCVCLE